MTKVILIIFIASFIDGCVTQYDANNPYTPRVLPKQARNIKNLGNNWLIFEMTLKGRQRCFLYHKQSEIAGMADVGSGFEAITEISSCKN